MGEWLGGHCSPLQLTLPPSFHQQGSVASHFPQVLLEKPVCLPYTEGQDPCLQEVWAGLCLNLSEQQRNWDSVGHQSRRGGVWCRPELWTQLVHRAHAPNEGRPRVGTFAPGLLKPLAHFFPLWNIPEWVEWRRVVRACSGDLLVHGKGVGDLAERDRK